MSSPTKSSTLEPQDARTSNTENQPQPEASQVTEKDSRSEDRTQDGTEHGSSAVHALPSRPKTSSTEGVKLSEAGQLPARAHESTSLENGHKSIGYTQHTDGQHSTHNVVPAIEDEKGARAQKSDAQANEESGPEITTIMDQFKQGQPIPFQEELKSPSGGGLPIFEYPPRSSSLEHRRLSLEVGGRPPGVLRQTDSGSYSTRNEDQGKSSVSYASSTVSQPPPPEPDPEPDLPFDFHRFLEQLRHRSADPVARFLKSFLHEFGKRQWAVYEQIKIVRDFLSFISGRMAQCEVWRTVSDAEFDNAQEGMEKLVMNRLYTQTFAPEIPPLPSTKGKKAPTASAGSGRKGQHQEDVERDEILAQKIRIYSWVREEHLDIKPAKEAKGKKFLRLAQQELVKIQNYRAPRDKVICVLNSCKVLFGYLRSAQAEQSADDFIPLLIYTVLRAAPEHLVSNVEYIQRFRNPDKLSGEAGYYMSSLLGAVQFIENLDRTSLSISDEDYEKNVEQSVAAIAERRSREESRTTGPPLPINEKSGLSRPEVTPRHSMEAEQVSPRRKSTRTSSNTNATDASASEESDDNAAVTGLLRTIQKPLSTIGRIFSDDTSPTNHGPARTPQPGTTPRMSPIPRQQAPNTQAAPVNGPPGAVAQKSRQTLGAEEAAARQVSAETAEAQRISRAEHQTVVETLCGMFPDLDRDIISDVVREKQGKVGLAVDACLSLSR